MQFFGAAARGRAPDAWAAAVGTVGPAGPGREPSAAELLRSLIGYEAPEGEPAQERIAGALGPLGALVHDRPGEGFRGCEDMLAPADSCSAGELRRAAALDDHGPCAQS